MNTRYVGGLLLVFTSACEPDHPQECTWSPIYRDTDQCVAYELFDAEVDPRRVEHPCRPRCLLRPDGSALVDCTDVGVDPSWPACPDDHPAWFAYDCPAGELLRVYVYRPERDCWALEPMDVPVRNLYLATCPQRMCLARDDGTAVQLHDEYTEILGWPHCEENHPALQAERCPD